MVIQQILENGVRVVMEPRQGVRSVAVGIWVNAGSVREAADEAGASHFIEHMVFKGTGRRSAADIAAEMDNVGGSINAFTSKECTCYYAKVLDEHLPIAVDMLADIVFHSAFDPEELEKERRVILEEILMTEDSPEDVSAETGNALFSTAILWRCPFSAQGRASAPFPGTSFFPTAGRIMCRRISWSPARAASGRTGFWRCWASILTFRPAMTARAPSANPIRVGGASALCRRMWSRCM